MGKDALIILSMRVAGTLLWLGYTVVLARSLDQADFATAVYVMNFSFVAVLVVTLGQDMALMKFASLKWAGGNRRVIRRVLLRARVLLLGSSAILTLALLGGTQLGIETPVTQSWDLALLSGLLTAAGAQMGLNRDCLRAIGRVWQSQLGLNLTRSVIPLCGSAVAGLMTGLTVNAALLLLLASLALSVLVEEMFLRRVDWAEGDADGTAAFADLTRMSLVLWPGDIATAVQMRAAGLIAGLTLAPETTALFLAAERIAGLAQFPIAAAAQAAGPKVARSVLPGQIGSQAVLSQGSLLMGLGALTGAGGAAVLAYPALWALGPDYLPALPIVLILVLAHASWGVLGLGQSALVLMGHHRVYSILSVLCCCAAVALIWAGFRQFGASGGAVAFCAAWWSTNLVYTIAVRLRVGLRTGIASVGRTTVSGAIRSLRLALKR